MAFDPDAYLAKKAGSAGPVGSGFDPDAYLAKKRQATGTPRAGVPVLPTSIDVKEPGGAVAPISAKPASAPATPAQPAQPSPVLKYLPQPAASAEPTINPFAPMSGKLAPVLPEPQMSAAPPEPSTLEKVARFNDEIPRVVEQGRLDREKTPSGRFMNQVLAMFDPTGTDPRSPAAAEGRLIDEIYKLAGEKLGYQNIEPLRFAAVFAPFAAPEAGLGGLTAELRGARQRQAFGQAVSNLKMRAAQTKAEAALPRLEKYMGKAERVTPTGMPAASPAAQRMSVIKDLSAEEVVRVTDELRAGPTPRALGPGKIFPVPGSSWGSSALRPIKPIMPSQLPKQPPFTISGVLGPNKRPYIRLDYVAVGKAPESVHLAFNTYNASLARTIQRELGTPVLTTEDFLAGHRNPRAFDIWSEIDRIDGDYEYEREARQRGATVQADGSGNVFIAQNEPTRLPGEISPKDMLSRVGMPGFIKTSRMKPVSSELGPAGPAKAKRYEDDIPIEARSDLDQLIAAESLRHQQGARGPSGMTVSSQRPVQTYEQAKAAGFYGSGAIGTRGSPEPDWRAPQGMSGRYAEAPSPHGQAYLEWKMGGSAPQDFNPEAQGPTKYRGPKRGWHDWLWGPRGRNVKARRAAGTPKQLPPNKGEIVPGGPASMMATGPAVPPKPPSSVPPTPNTPGRPPGPLAPSGIAQDVDALLKQDRRILDKLADVFLGGRHTRAPADVAASISALQSSQSLSQVQADITQALRSKFKTEHLSALDKDLKALYRDPRWATSSSSSRRALWDELSAKHGPLLQEARRFSEAAMSESQDLSRALAEEHGVVSDFLTIARDTGDLDAYQTRAFLKYTIPDWGGRAPAPALDRLAAYLQNQPGEAKTRSELVMEVAEVINARKPPTQLGEVNSTGRAISKLMAKKDIPQEVLEAMGEMESGTDLLGLQLAFQRMIKARLDTMRAVARNSQSSSLTPGQNLPEHTYPVGDHPKFGELRGRYVSRQMWEALGTSPNMEAASHGVARVFREISSWMKGSQLSFKLAPIINSVMQSTWGGVLTGSVDLTKPLQTGKSFARALRALNDYHRDPTGAVGDGWIVVEALRTGADHAGFSREEIGSGHSRRFFRDIERAFPKRQNDFSDQLISVLRRIHNNGKGALEWGGKGLDYFDRIFRIQSYLHNVDSFLAELAQDGLTSSLVQEGMLPLTFDKSTNLLAPQAQAELARFQQAAARARIIRASTDHGFLKTAAERQPRWAQRDTGASTSFTGSPTGPAISAGDDAEAYRIVVEAATGLATNRNNMSLYNPQFPAPYIKLARDYTGILAQYLTPAAEVNRILLQLFANVENGKVVPGRLYKEKGLGMRILKNMLVMGAVFGAGGLARRYYGGFRDEDVEQALASQPNAKGYTNPGAFVWLDRDSKGRAIMVDVSKMFDPLRFLSGHPDDALWRKVMANMLLQPFDGSMSEPYARAGIENLGIARQPNQTPANLDKKALYGMLLPDAARGVMEAGRKGQLWGGLGKNEEEYTPTQAAMRAAGISNFYPVTTEPSRKRAQPGYEGEVEIPNPSWKQQKIENAVLRSEFKKDIIRTKKNSQLTPEEKKAQVQRLKDTHRQEREERRQRDDLKYKRPKTK